jgi:tRNA A37 threonylcarbamoyltransferase TsaD
MPPLDLCTDNAAMIAAAGFFGGRRPAAVDPSLGWGA